MNPSRAVDARALIDVFAASRALKTLPRAGWVRTGVNHPESVADHSFRVALMTLLCAPACDECVDRDRAVRMALVHDLAECVVGDITPHDGVSEEEKGRMEGEAMRGLTRALGASGDETRALWEEYEAGTTAEARLVKDMDKLEMILQAQEYESEGDAGESGRLEQFFESTRGRFRTALGKALSEEIERRRPAA